MKTLEITIAENGDARIEANGYKGKACLVAIEEFRRATGGKVTQSHAKPELYQTENKLKAGQ